MRMRPKDPSLVLISLRLRRRDIAAARQVAKRESIPYQLVIRRWVMAEAQRQRSPRG